ncbi:hypothetical protein [Aggregatilinea lenta]|uniref:hypothetical protein n=1 Tax=Aggregatilinea lenta TaxID=913108 RepID=UPI000E5B7447|nr:hypothetical protein [Aggregatilinea lenta]
MNPQQYEAFTCVLVGGLERDPRVVGLMAAGSMAAQSHPPDQWSDHDFWLVVATDAQPDYQGCPDWLPDPAQIVLWFREPHGGFKAMYRDGHLLEYAVSDRAGLLHARVNDYRLLIDRIDLAADLARMHRATVEEAQTIAQNEVSLLGQFLTNLLVGIWRLRRGEQLSARQLITVSSLFSLLQIIPRHVPTDHPDALDNLDPLRRVELAYPDLGAEINALLRLDLDRAALGLLDLSDRLLRGRLAEYPAEAVATVRAHLLD